MTKLLPPKPQAALLQIPPSQKETQGAESTLCFHARPHANSKLASVTCGPSGVLRWPVGSTSPQLG